MRLKQGSCLATLQISCQGLVDSRLYAKPTSSVVFLMVMSGSQVEHISRRPAGIAFFKQRIDLVSVRAAMVIVSLQLATDDWRILPHEQPNGAADRFRLKALAASE